MLLATPIDFAPRDRLAPPFLTPATGAAVASPPQPPAAGLLAVLDQLDTGVLVCDVQARLLISNAAARAELAQGGVLRVHDDGGLHVGGGAALLLLRRAVHNAVQGGRRQLLPLRDGDRALMVAVQPLPGDGLGPTRALLLLGRRQLAPALAVEMLGGVYELTLAERRVLSGLLAGLRVQALARAHGVAVSTVRTQVAALRAKFGVRRLDDITRLAAELPPMVSALRGPAASPG